jgi:hypothetical protein
VETGADVLTADSHQDAFIGIKNTCTYSCNLVVGFQQFSYLLDIDKVGKRILTSILLVHIKNPYPGTEDMGLVIEVFSSADRPAGFTGPVTLRPRIAPGLLFSENFLA